MYQDKKLVVFFAMHRSGSSFTARLFQRLGLSLGPFKLAPAVPANPYGYFGASPILGLNCDLQTAAFGFPHESPFDAKDYRRFRECDGQWPSGHVYSTQQRQLGRELIERLVASGRVSGFKDPRTVLTWPFWQNVLNDFPSLPVVGLFLLRSPHEIAMSMIRRSRRRYSYEDALGLVAVHYRRMRDILCEWRGKLAVLQFEPRLMAVHCPMQPLFAALRGTKRPSTRSMTPSAAIIGPRWSITRPRNCSNCSAARHRRSFRPTDNQEVFFRRAEFVPFRRAAAKNFQLLMVQRVTATAAISGAESPASGANVVLEPKLARASS